MGSEGALCHNQFVVHYTEPIAPLIHPRDSLEKLLFCAEKGIPVIYTSATTAAQNGPATLAGALAQCNARILSGIVIAQLKQKGAKMIVTVHATAMDPMSGDLLLSTMEEVLGILIRETSQTLNPIAHRQRA